MPGVPSILQVGWLVLTAIGLAASPVARRWWVKVWPPEERAEYAVARGYVAAKVLRAAAFLLLFLPAVAVPAAIAGLCNRLLPAVSRS